MRRGETVDNCRDYSDEDDFDDDLDGLGGERSQNDGPWPDQFRIPFARFGEELRLTLDRKFTLQKHMKGQLLQALYDELTQYTYYPTNIQYAEVITQLLIAFPYLKMNLTTRDAKYLWTKSLRTKFRNHRRRHDFNLLEVQMKRKKLE